MAEFVRESDEVPGKKRSQDASKDTEIQEPITMSVVVEELIRVNKIATQYHKLIQSLRDDKKHLEGTITEKQEREKILNQEIKELKQKESNNQKLLERKVEELKNLQAEIIDLRRQIQQKDVEIDHLKQTRVAEPKVSKNEKLLKEELEKLEREEKEIEETKRLERQEIDELKEKKQQRQRLMRKK